ncbi:arsenate reductase ArsC [bacterium]|nr:arsenate reductase ArsC [bacterium]
MTSIKTSILFVCTHNSARSQMAEALLRNDFGDKYESFSAGTEKTVVKPHALLALQEIGIDTEKLYSKTVDDLAPLQTDIVVTVCDHAKESCPFVVGRKQTIHHEFEDPSSKGNTPSENLQAFRDTRDQIREWIRSEFGA